jgi:hypothetical protein
MKKKLAITIGFGLAVGIALLWLRPSTVSTASAPTARPTLEEQVLQPTQSPQHPASAAATESSPAQLEEFSKAVHAALEPMKGAGVKVTEMKNAPSKKLIRLKDGTELVELTFEHGGKTYLPKGEDDGIGVPEASSR